MLIFLILTIGGPLLGAAICGVFGALFGESQKQKAAREATEKATRLAAEIAAREKFDAEREYFLFGAGRYHGHPSSSRYL